MSHLKTLAVVNPNSANKSTGRIWPQIRNAIKLYVPAFDEIFTQQQGHATEIVGKALSEGYQLIVSVGGDGTNNEVVNGFFDGQGKLISPNACFGIICRGTGGDLRKTLGVPLEFKEAASYLAGDSYRVLDVGKMTHIDRSGKQVVRYFINITSFGIGGFVDERVNRSSKALGGKISFLYASLVSMFTYKNQPVRLIVDGKDLGEQTIFNVAVANGQYFGGGMWVAPQAKMDDGLFDIVVLGDFKLNETLTQMSKIYKGTHLNHPKVTFLRGKSVKADSPEKVYLDVDGEAPGSLPATFEILPGAIRFKIKA